MAAIKTKPPYSKDGRLQLCSRCNKYCGRTKNICPTCAKRDDAWREIRAGLNLDLSKMKPTEWLSNQKHFIGTFDGKIGYFLIWNPGMVLDREAFREIVSEAKALGLQMPLMIYGRIATYMGPGIDFMQIDIR